MLRSTGKMGDFWGLTLENRGTSPIITVCFWMKPKKPFGDGFGIRCVGFELLDLELPFIEAIISTKFHSCFE